MNAAALPPAPPSKPSCAFHKKLYDWFQIVLFVLYVAFTVQCLTPLYLSICHVIGSLCSTVSSVSATLSDVLLQWVVFLCYFMSCMCLHFDIKYLYMQYNMHLLQSGNCFAENFRDSPTNYDAAFHVFPCIILPHGFTNIIIFSMTRWKSRCQSGSTFYWVQYYEQ